MAIIVCPNCGHKQEGGAKCHKCASLFSYYPAKELQEGKAAAKPPVQGNKTLLVFLFGRKNFPSPESGRWLAVRRLYSVVRWSSFAGLVIVILLVLHKSPPPRIPYDPQAAVRAETKLAESQAAAAEGRSHQLVLDKAELNSFLDSNLALEGRAMTSGGATTIPPAPAAPPVADSSSPGSASTGSSIDSTGPAMQQVQSSVTDVKVDIVGDLVKAYVVFDFHGQDLSLELDGHLRAEGGYLRFDPTDGKLGSLPLPQSTLNAAVAKLLSSPENREKLRLAPGVSSVQILDGQVVISYSYEKSSRTSSYRLNGGIK